MDQHSAEDLVQSFATEKILADGMISKAERHRGRFRTYLLASLNNFVASQMRAQGRFKRAPRMRLPLEEAAAVVDAGVAARPAAAFDVEWARQVLSQAIDEMAAECRAGARPDVWAVFEARILLPVLEDAEPVPYAVLVATHGFASPAQASNVLVTGIRMFVRTLRRVIGAYARDDAEVDDEIEDLRRILSRSSAQGRWRQGV